jgi:hypothetical protein
MGGASNGPGGVSGSYNSGNSTASTIANTTSNIANTYIMYEVMTSTPNSDILYQNISQSDSKLTKEQKILSNYLLEGNQVYEKLQPRHLHILADKVIKDPQQLTDLKDIMDAHKMADIIAKSPDNPDKIKRELVSAASGIFPRIKCGRNVIDYLCREENFQAFIESTEATQEDKALVSHEQNGKIGYTFRVVTECRNALVNARQNTLPSAVTHHAHTNIHTQAPKR